MMIPALLGAQMSMTIVAGGARATFANGYAYCKVVTVKTYNGGSGGMVSGTSNFTDFPALISFTDADLAVTGSGGYVQNSSGFDIVFDDSTSCSGTGTTVNWELERYTSTSGQYIAHMKFGTLHYNSDDKVSMYFGKTGISTFQGSATSTWNSNYKAVWHLPDGTTFSGADSVASGHTMTSAGGVTAGAGQVDGAGVFGATNGYTSTSAFTLQSGQTFTIQAWTKITSGNMAGRNTIFGTTPNNTGGNFSWELGSQASVMSNTFEVLVPGNNVKKATDNSYPTDGNWHSIAVTRNGTGDTFAFYVDGAPVSGATPGGTTSIVDFGDTGGTKQIGVRTTASTQLFQGSIDEVRYSDVARSADWLKTEYRNQSAPGTYITLGARTTP